MLVVLVVLVVVVVLLLVVLLVLVLLLVVVLLVVVLLFVVVVVVVVSVFPGLCGVESLQSISQSTRARTVWERLLDDRVQLHPLIRRRTQYGTARLGWAVCRRPCTRWAMPRSGRATRGWRAAAAAGGLEAAAAVFSWSSRRSRCRPARPGRSSGPRSWASRRRRRRTSGSRWAATRLATGISSCCRRHRRHSSSVGSSCHL
eukprot:COSAG02_NODE_32_length_50374_cov_46.674013_9_plen_202_part_00